LAKVGNSITNLATLHPFGCFDESVFVSAPSNLNALSRLAETLVLGLEGGVNFIPHINTSFGV